MIWIISEIYFPDEDGTAYYLTRLAEYLAGHFSVGVICGRPKYSARRAQVPRREVRRGVRIVRCFDIALNKNFLPGRFINAIFIGFSMFLKAVSNLRRGDTAIVVTNPPVMPFLAFFACRVKRARCYLRVDDVYPEAMIAAGLLRKGGFAARLMGYFSGVLYNSVDRVIVLGRDMESLVGNRMIGNRSRIRLIQNWAETDAVRPAAKTANSLLRGLRLDDKFVVQCAGNMGRVQAVETMFGAAERLLGESRIHFLFIGQGAKSTWMERERKRKGLNNVTLVGHLPRHEQNAFLNACDVAMASLVTGLRGAGVPSRMYNVMSAGKPLVAVADPDSELCRVVAEENIGWCVSPDDPAGLAETIRDALRDPAKLEAFGARARRVAEQKYASKIILERYKALVENGEHEKGLGVRLDGRDARLGDFQRGGI